MCSLCATPLCTIPREGESDMCCFQYWHAHDELKPRVYLKQNARNTKKNTEKLQSESEEEEEIPTQKTNERENAEPTPTPAVDELRRKQAKEAEEQKEKEEAEDKAE